jgi:hypothetical protein
MEFYDPAEYWASDDVGSMIEQWVIDNYCNVPYARIVVRDLTPFQGFWSIEIQPPAAWVGARRPQGETRTLTQSEFDDIPVGRRVKHLLERLRLRDYWVNDPNNRRSP